MWRCCADETQVHIGKHVLKTLCTDVTNILLNFLAADLMMSVENPAAISGEVRPGRPLVEVAPGPRVADCLCFHLRSESRYWPSCRKRPKDL